MVPLKILLIEHSAKIEGFKAAMELADAKVDVLPYPKEEKLKNMLNDTHYDLVVTDAYFLAEGEEHNLDNEEDGEYLLDKVISIVRGIDNKRIKIAVYTYFSNPLLKDSDKKADLKHADYIWDKRCASDNLTYWQVKRIHEDINKKFPEHTLVDSLISLITPDSNLPFAPNLNLVLKTYRERAGEVEQIESVKTDLTKIAENFKLDEEFKKLFQFITKAEPLNVARKPSAWGHLRHALNVFWLGYYFLNSGLINLEGIYDQMHLADGKKSLSKEEKTRTINIIWFMSSLFHDVGLPAEGAVDIAKNSSKLFSIYPKTNLALQLIDSVDTICSNFEADLDKIFSSITGGLSEWVSGCRRTLREQKNLDHGLVSGITLYRLLSDKNKSVANECSKCVALHNLANIFFNQNANEISFHNDPIACLLIICDQLEVWDRETGLESYLSGPSIESYELRKLNFDQIGNHFDLEINYVPYRFISPKGREMEKINVSIYKFLTDKVKPVLNLIGFKNVFGADITVKFILDGRTDIWKWTTD